MVLTKWSSDTTLKFILLYKEQECLWKVDNITYRDRSARISALRKILNGMNLPGLTMDDVKKKIKYLRSTYMVEVNKIEKSMLSNDSSEIYVPCLTWFNVMNSFIQSINVDKDSSFKHERISSISADEDYNSNDVIVNAEHECRTSQPPEFLDVKGFPASRKRRRRSLAVERQGHSNRHLNISQNKSKITHQDNKADMNEFEIFGKYVGIQLKSLDEEDTIMAQQEIQSILTRYKLKKMRRKTERIHIVHTPSSCSSDIRPSGCMSPESPNIADENKDTQYLDDSPYDEANDDQIDKQELLVL